MTKEQEVNKIAKQFGFKIERWAIDWEKTCFKGLPREKIGRGDIANALTITGLKKEAMTWSDEYYYLTNLEAWTDFMEYDWVDLMTYHYDYWDCDDFAKLFKIRAGMILDCNSVVYAWGSVYEKTTGKFVAGHAFVLIPAWINGQIRIYCYEPMTDKMVEVLSGHPIIIGDWKYVPSGLRV